MTPGHTQAWRGNYSLWSSFLSPEWLGGIGSLLHKVFSYKIPGERPAGFRHIGGGAGNTADGCDLLAKQTIWTKKNISCLSQYLSAGKSWFIGNYGQSKATRVLLPAKPRRHRFRAFSCSGNDVVPITKIFCALPTLFSNVLHKFKGPNRTRGQSGRFFRCEKNKNLSLWPKTRCNCSFCQYQNLFSAEIQRGRRLVGPLKQAKRIQILNSRMLCISQFQQCPSPPPGLTPGH